MSKIPSNTDAVVFISHSHADRTTAVEVQAVLENSGANTFLDQDAIQAGDSLPKRLRLGIESCTVFLLLWSHSASASAWVRNEWELAYELRRKIVPYLIDATPLPSGLENLVYVELTDKQVANANLLHAVFGRNYSPDPNKLFPGDWRAETEVPGLGHGATYDFTLRPNGQIDGEMSLNLSQVPPIGQLLGNLGLGAFGNMHVPFVGSWAYEPTSRLLTLNTTSYVGGRQVPETIFFKATGTERTGIDGTDQLGRGWRLSRRG